MAELTPRLALAEEADLLARASRLEPDALGRVHDVYYPFIFRYTAFRVGDRETAEDLTSEVFTRLLTALHAGRAPRQTLAGWLYGVANHVVQDHFRRHERHGTAELPESLADRAPLPADQAERALVRGELHRAVAELTEEQQSVIALRFGDDLPIQEVARLIGKTEGAVKQLQARAVVQLARRLVPGSAES